MLFPSSAVSTSPILRTLGDHSFSNVPNMFDKMPQREAAALIRLREREGLPGEGLALFRELARNQQWHSWHSSSSLPLSTALACCAALGIVNLGREIHGFMMRGVFRNVTDACCSESSLVHFYASCGLLSTAREVFSRMPQRDVVTWTCMLMAYADREEHEDEVMDLLLEMLNSGVLPNRHTVTVVLRCAKLEQVKQIHSFATKNGWDSDTVVGGALADAYARNGGLRVAHSVFDRVKHKDVVCYNSLILAYGRTGIVEGVSQVFNKMSTSGVAPNKSTFSSLLNSCANFGQLSLSKQFHAQAIIHGLASDVVLQGVVIDMYAKCSDLDAARAAFNQTGAENSLIAWNSMICAHGKHGHTEEALELFSLMQLSSVPPDHITFTCLLSACSHSGLINEAQKLFKLMDEVCKIQARNEHYCCMVDLLGRAGMVTDAYNLICSSKQEFGPSVWGALLSACKMWSDAEIGEIAARKLFELEPECSGAYVALASIYEVMGQTEEATKMRELMDGRGIRKDTGYSWIEAGGAVRRFRVGKDLHCHKMEEIECVCKRLHSCICDQQCLNVLVDLEVENG